LLVRDTSNQAGLQVPQDQMAWVATTVNTTVLQVTVTHVIGIFQYFWIPAYEGMRLKSLSFTGLFSLILSFEQYCGLF
jgi:hypothetical protein